jgi:DNA-binding IclR family transcriptional regulator
VKRRSAGWIAEAMTVSATETPAGADKYMVPAVQSAGHILQYLAGYNHPHATLAQISSSLELNKTSCLRILRTLVSMGFVHYDEPTKTYSLGVLLFVFGNRAAERLDSLSTALPFMSKAMEITGLTSVIVQRYTDTQHMYVAKAEAQTPIRVSVAVGQRFPLVAGAHGKVLLAGLPAKEAERLVKRVGLEKFTSRSITEVSEYMAALEVVRADGYALSLEEHYEGISGFSVPVYDALGRVVLAMSSFGISKALKQSRLREMAQAVKDLADEASKKLGADLVHTA